MRSQVKRQKPKAKRQNDRTERKPNDEKRAGSQANARAGGGGEFSLRYKSAELGSHNNLLKNQSPGRLPESPYVTPGTTLLVIQDRCIVHCSEGYLDRYPRGISLATCPVPLRVAVPVSPSVAPLVALRVGRTVAARVTPRVAVLVALQIALTVALRTARRFASRVPCSVGHLKKWGADVRAPRSNLDAQT